MKSTFLFSRFFKQTNIFLEGERTAILTPRTEFNVPRLSAVIFYTKIVVIPRTSNQATLSSLSLSTASSGLNSLTAVTVEDIVKPRYPDMSARKMMLVSKLIGIIAS